MLHDTLAPVAGILVVILAGYRAAGSLRHLVLDGLVQQSAVPVSGEPVGLRRLVSLMIVLFIIGLLVVLFVAAVYRPDKLVP